MTRYSGRCGRSSRFATRRVFGLQLSGAVARTPRFRLGASVSRVDRQTTGMDDLRARGPGKRGQLFLRLRQARVDWLFMEEYPIAGRSRAGDRLGRSTAETEVPAAGTPGAGLRPAGPLPLGADRGSTGARCSSAGSRAAAPGRRHSSRMRVHLEGPNRAARRPVGVAHLCGRSEPIASRVHSEFAEHSGVDPAAFICSCSSCGPCRD
jgi:hypothetical protein